MVRAFLVAAAWLLVSCSSLPAGVALDPDLGGTWTFVGGEPQADPLLPWEGWPDARLTIDAARGTWSSEPRPGHRGVLPARARVSAVQNNVLTLEPAGGRAFDVYYRLRDGQLEFWWGDHPDWLKPYVVYRRPVRP